MPRPLDYDPPLEEVQHPVVVGYTEETPFYLRWLGFPRYRTYTKVHPIGGGGWDVCYHSSPEPRP